jgi:hypothetical protein
MKRLRRLFPLLAAMFGLLGIVACAAALAGVWSTASRLNKASENVFDVLDNSLLAVRERVDGAQKRVQESKITTEGIRQSVRNWTLEETSQRLATRLKLAEKTERLALALHQADQLLQTSEASIQGVQQAIEIASSLGAPVDAAFVDSLQERLKELRRQFKQSTETAAAIRENVSKAAEGEVSQERITQVAQLALRVVATLGQIDTRMGQLEGRLSDLQSRGQQLKSKTHFYIVTAELCAVLLIAWMAAGQVCMCRHGWKNQPLSRSEG